MQLQATQDKLLKGFTVSAKERAEIGKRRIYQSELKALQLSSSTGGMTLEEEIMERQRQHEAKLVKQGVKVRLYPLWLIALRDS